MTYDFPPQGGCNVTLPGPSLQSLCSAAEYVVFMTALDAAVRSNPIISGNCERIRPIEEPAQEYDFIVAGAGAGGATVAARLAEINDWQILLIEAGDDESAAGQIPGFTSPLAGSEIDWNYHTTNESYACLPYNGSCYWSSARSLGGNTAHNGMVYLRGNPTDYNNWVAMGNDGWEWEKVLEFYKRQEDNANIDEVGREYHSTGGPLSVGYFPYISELTEPFLEAAEQSGFGVTKDLNGKQLTGLTVIQSTQKRGVRMSSASAYLRPHRNSKNLEIALKSNVTKIIIENKTAVGVEYIKNGRLRSVRARREVIISLGTMRSPQLLLLSGIGPKKHLESMGIKTIVDLPGVGENLQDHVGLIMMFTINRPDTYDNDVLIANQYLENQTGLLSTTGVPVLVGMDYTNKSFPEYPDFQLTISAFNGGCAPGEVGALRSDRKLQIAFVVANIHPKSRGRVSLASNDPLDLPVFWANYLSDPEDIDVILDGIEIALKLAEASPLRNINLTLDTEPLQACSNYTFLSRDYWACATRQNMNSLLHQVGSCKMGPVFDPMAVVDPQLRVHGIRNLRIVDASIMPKITSGNTGVPTMMIGERGADFIKNTWLL